MEITAQIIGIMAMILNVIVFSMKNQKTMIATQFVASVLFSTNMLLLGAISGGLLNVAAIIRGVVFLNKKRLGKYKHMFTLGLMVLYVVCYILGFVVFGKPTDIKNLLIELLPVIGIILMTIGFAADNAKKTRFFGFLNSPPWLVYNIINFNIGGILCEIFCMIFAIWGMIRYDRKGVIQNG